MAKPTRFSPAPKVWKKEPVAQSLNRNFFDKFRASFSGYAPPVLVYRKRGIKPAQRAQRAIISIFDFLHKGSKAMEGEQTLGEIYDGIADKLAEARTRALMGERQQALGILQGAALEMMRFKDALRGVPGYLALDHAFEVTRQTLRAEQDAAALRAVAATKNTQEKQTESGAEKPRRRLKKAA
jgi:hypothetical protein